jgi:dethiobiotin synthetase
MKAYFITATDTDAGKTFISTQLLTYWHAQGYKTLGFKPVASGCQQTEQGLRNDDALQIQAASNVSLSYEKINPYAFVPAIAPHIAAEQAGVHINLTTITQAILPYQTQVDRLLVEGVGGWAVPLNQTESVAELANALGFPVILLVKLQLGCINQALLSAQAIQHSGVKIAGWIANNCHENNAMQSQNETILAIQQRLEAPLLGVVPYVSEQDNFLISDFIDLS